MRLLHTNIKRSMRTGAAALLAVGLLAACSHKQIDQPAKLAPIKSTLRVRTIWTASVGGFHPFGLWEGQTAELRLGLGLTVHGNRLFAAGHDGVIAAFNVRSGRELWRVDAHAPLGGGPAVHGTLLVVGATDGQVIAFDAATGKRLWGVRLPAAVISAPAVSAHRVAVCTIDGILHVLSSKNGHELWEKPQDIPSLTLRGAAVPVVTHGLVISGFPNGKVLAVDASDGATKWLATVSNPTGRSAIARLADLDGPVAVAGKNVYVVGYHGTVDMLSLKNGHPWWTHKASSFRGVTLGRHALYISTADGAVEALNRKNGALIWRQAALRYRAVTRPALSSDGVIVADYQGYVSWMNKRTGAFEARRGTGGVRVSNPPVVVGNEVIVINDLGAITALRVTPK
jgi:outer membrane protein assembly factor BamB